jgi:hypothetical protein
MKKWPGSDDAANFKAKGFGVPYAPKAQPPTEGWGVVATADGCTNTDGYQFCVPDTSAGPCDFMGSWDSAIQMPRMRCGAKGNTAAQNKALTANQKAASHAWAEALIQLVQGKPKSLCKCKSDWSATKLAAMYCAGNKDKAKGEVDKATCPSGPKVLNGIVKAKDDTHSATTIGDYFKHPQKPMTKWCAVEDPNCDAGSFKAADPCAHGEVWMMTPNNLNLKQQGTSQQGTAAVFSGSQLVQSEFWPDPKNAQTAMDQFYPMRLPANALEGGWIGDYTKAGDNTNKILDFAQKLKTLHASTDYDFTDDKANLAKLQACNADCQKKKDDNVKNTRIANDALKGRCIKTSTCKAVLDGLNCIATAEKSFAACTTSSTCQGGTQVTKVAVNTTLHMGTEAEAEAFAKHATAATIFEESIQGSIPAGLFVRVTSVSEVHLHRRLSAVTASRSLVAHGSHGVIAKYTVATPPGYTGAAFTVNSIDTDKLKTHVKAKAEKVGLTLNITGAIVPGQTQAQTESSGAQPMAGALFSIIIAAYFAGSSRLFI